MKPLRKRVPNFYFKSLLAIVGVGIIGIAFQNCGGGSGSSGSDSNSSAGLGDYEIISPKSLFSNQTSVEFTFAPRGNNGIWSGPGLLNAECVIANASTGVKISSVDCRTGTATFTNLTQGAYVLTMQGLTADLKPVIPLMTVINVDHTKPSGVVNGPPATTALTGAEFTFYAIERETPTHLAYECSLDSAAFQECKSPLALSGLTAGPHVLKLRAIDGAGNVSDEVSHAWEIDLQAPSVLITAKPAIRTNTKSATFEFSGSDDAGLPPVPVVKSLESQVGALAVTGFECAVNSEIYLPCTSPKTVDGLLEAANVFRVRSVDGAGNKSSPMSYQWDVDTTPPSNPLIETNVTGNELLIGRLSEVGLRITSTDLSGTPRLECVFDGAPLTECRTSTILKGLSAGSHQISVVAIDTLGNRSQTVTRSWTTQPTLKLKSIALGGAHACGIVDNAQETAVCWGANGNGQLGNGTTTNAFVATEVPGLSRVRKIVAGLNHTCALHEISSVTYVSCWGLNSAGQITNAAIGAAVLRPIVSAPNATLYGHRGVRDVISGKNHICAHFDVNILSRSGLSTPDDMTFCWGDNTTKQVNPTSTSTAIRLIDQGYSFKSRKLLAAPGGTCYVNPNNEVTCFGQVATTFPAVFTEPKIATALAPYAPAIEMNLAVYSGGLCGAATDGLYQCVSAFSGAGFGTLLSPLLAVNEPLKSVSYTEATRCYVTNDALVKCSGANTVLQVGVNSSGAPVNTPTVVPLDLRAKSVANSDKTTCALFESGEVSCWGANGQGAAGLGANGANYAAGNLLR